MSERYNKSRTTIYNAYNFLEWEARDKIASGLQIGAGTVSGIVSDLAPRVRLYNFSLNLGQAKRK